MSNTKSGSISILIAYRLSDVARRQSLIDGRGPLPDRMEQHFQISIDLVCRLGSRLDLDEWGRASLDMTRTAKNDTEYYVETLNLSGEVMVVEWLCAGPQAGGKPGQDGVPLGGGRK